MPSAATCNSAGKDISVIGTSWGGIGAAIARVIQDAGANVVITGDESVTAEEDRSRLELVQLDVRDAAAVAVRPAHKEWTDVLVDCAFNARGEMVE